jgi:hypothetical protein
MHSILLTLRTGKQSAALILVAGMGAGAITCWLESCANWAVLWMAFSRSCTRKITQTVPKRLPDIADA